ncbi:ATP-binding protein [Haloplanus aerogenes]|uniref:histidine kinase n=1 Tax=Haloplanus aerogenes TaxID=660522 RepID=A0A3M0DUA1_9EURY|nr:ATP-binding protein [Haloplanus aerogenes]AZH25817.1 PAS domain S-box protein [Haloplanus aerogenes]RMB25559.1 PAS domain S-box-containing protein [Haloplanus aerogenes]
MSGEHGGSDETTVGHSVGTDLTDLLDDRTGHAGLTGRLEAVVDGIAPVWRRRIGGGTVVGIGTLLIGVPLYHFARHGVTVDAIVGDALPLFFGVILVATGVWLGWMSDDDVAPLVTAFWVTVGFGVTGVVTLYFFTLHVAHGHIVESPWFLVYDVSATGAVGGLLISRYDVRSRHRHRRLSQRERQLRAVFEGTLDALVITDDEGRYVAANPAAADLFGLPRSELVGKHIVNFASGSEDFEAQWETFRAEGEARGEFELVRPDGETRMVAFAATANVLPGRHLSALRDVTEQIEHEQELGQERARVEFLNRLLRHNVLNGMNLVLAKLDALEPALPDDQRDSLDVARHRSEEIVDLIQTARRLATDVAAEADGRAIRVCDPLTDAIESVRGAYPDPTIECDLPADEVWVHADGMLETVFDHLLTNAVEHNDADVSVSVGVTVDPETVTVTVADDGEGMPPERLAQLFDDEEFTHTRDWGGFGLSIVQALVQEYDGDVWADANEPSGTVFHVELQRTESPDGA